MTKGYYGMREKDVVYEEPQRFIIDNLRSVLKEVGAGFTVAGV